MYQNYLITGATGFLGSAVVQLLLAHGCRVLALVKDRDPLIYTLPNHVAVFYGDLTDKESLRDFFAAGGDDFCVLHCAGLISIASKPDEALYAVNVQGTQNIVDLCREFGAGRLIYVSCGPDSLGRDLRTLTAAGWRVDHAQPFDLMPGTAQVETVVRLVR